MANAITDDTNPLMAWMMSTGHPVSYWARRLKISPAGLYRWAEGSRSIKAEDIKRIMVFSEDKLTLDDLLYARKKYLISARRPYAKRGTGKRPRPKKKQGRTKQQGRKPKRKISETLKPYAHKPQPPKAKS